MDLLNLSAEQRVNLADLSFAVTDSILGQHAELAQGLFLPASGQAQASIISGFAPMAASNGGPVTVGQAQVTNAAFLCRVAADGSLRPAELVFGGNSVVGIDISTFPTNTYGIYVRGNRTAQTVQNRAFWSGVDASEYAQLTPTRQTASWEVRLETASPGPEWLQIGQAQVTAASSGGQGATVVVTDQRPLFFEGQAANNYAPTWGSAADRTGRRAATITSLATMVDALKQCIVDIKGRTLQPWYSPAIGGLNVGGSFGLSDVPVNNRLAVGDANFNLALSTDGTVSINFNGLNSFTSPSNAIRFSRSTNSLSLNCGPNAVVMASDGSVLTGGFTLSPPNTMFRVFNGATAVGEFSSTAAPGGFLTVSSSGTDAGGSIYFRRYAGVADPSAGNWVWRIRGYADNSALRFELGGVNLVGGNSSTPLAATIPRQSNLSSVTTLSGDSVYIKTGDGYLYLEDKIVFPGVFPYIVGSSQSVKSNGTGNAAGSSAGANSNVSYRRDLTDNRKVLIASFGSLPANYVVVANAARYTSANDDQTGFSVQYRDIGGAQIEFCLTDDSGTSEYGSFNYVIFSGG